METTEKVDRVNLDLISASTTNRMFRSAKKLSREALTELTASISEVGVVQPVGLRPDPEKPGFYILIFGERRTRASKYAGKLDIPAYIRAVDESEAFDIQITENLQREDVHALNEAKGYRMLLEKNEKLTTADLAARFGKSETYILQRLKLNDLVAEGKRDFYDDKMSVGHAIILSRLLPADQREAISRIASKEDGYGTIVELQAFVNRHIINNLSAAPFKTDDAELVKKAGPCSLCPKRTGSSPLLFADMSDKDRCLDRSCFLNKCNSFVVRMVKETIETRPEVVFLVDYNTVLPDVVALLQEHKIKALREYDDFSNHEKTGEKVKGVWISGNRAGFSETVHLKAKAASSKIPDDKEGVIAGIKSRVKRGRELDKEKVYAKILAALREHPTQTKEAGKLQPAEEVLLWFIVFDKGGYQVKHALEKIIGNSKGDPEKFYMLLKNLKHEKKALMLRKVMLDQYGSNLPNSNPGFIIRKIAEGYGNIDIKTFERDQDEIRTKREDRANDRIKQIKNQ